MNPSTGKPLLLSLPVISLALLFFIVQVVGSIDTEFLLAKQGVPCGNNIFINVWLVSFFNVK